MDRWRTVLSAQQWYCCVCWGRPEGLWAQFGISSEAVTRRAGSDGRAVWSKDGQRCDGDKQRSEVPLRCDPGRPI